jgi:hypothetical protein
MAEEIFLLFLLFLSLLFFGIHRIFLFLRDDNLSLIHLLRSIRIASTIVRGSLGRILNLVSSSRLIAEVVLTALVRALIGWLTVVHLKK